ncbi:uncharacterized protein FRV6_06962 [Fusarium oxysporum]|uniref:FAD-binding domain-containing protein n=1 Tax=Fusarium oxysporum TaxID=5507 RepID=A0A2H3T599_FUSOX|nr:uncharacterized protein FRV6_06962 [Fusarium oxysporum]
MASLPKARSVIRGYMFPNIECTSKTNCYRSVWTREQAAQDPDLQEITKTMNFWMAPNRLIIQSVMADIGSVAINLYHPEDSGTAGSWKAPGDVDQMRELFSDFDPSMQKLLSLVRDCISWKMVEVPPLPSWVSQGGKMILIGDAAHAMAPYVGQVAELLEFASLKYSGPSLLQYPMPVHEQGPMPFDLL